MSAESSRTRCPATGRASSTTMPMITTISANVLVFRILLDDLLLHIRRKRRNRLARNERRRLRRWTGFLRVYPLSVECRLIDRLLLHHQELVEVIAFDHLRGAGIELFSDDVGEFGGAVE